MHGSLQWNDFFCLMMIYTNLGNIEDSIATLVVPRSMEDSASAKPINVRSGRLNIENISFRYSEHKQALTAVSLVRQELENQLWFLASCGCTTQMKDAS